MRCDRCAVDTYELFCTGCGGPAHGECDADALGLGDVCRRCWAILSHVDGVIDCASGCTCEKDYPEIFED